jgi:hypothetical protein
MSHIGFEFLPSKFPRLLTSPSQGLQPALSDLTPEGIQGLPISGYTKVIDDATDHADEVPALVGHRDRPVVV